MAAAASNVLQWAKANESREKRQGWRLQSLLKGERDGTVRHPFRVIDREDYLAKIKGRGIVKRVDTAPVDTVDLEGLTGIQKSVNVERLGQHLEDESLIPEGQRSAHAGMLTDLPVIVKSGGQHYVHDGHHRATAAWVRGERAIGARVVDLDGH
jgi:hypothetical protein